MVYQNFTTFTEVDVGANRIQKTAYHVDHKTYRNETTYLYKNYGVGYFDDFTHTVQVKSDFVSGTMLGHVWMLSNDLNNHLWLRQNGKQYICVFFYGTSGAPRLYLEEGQAGGGHANTPYVCVAGTTYYLRIYRVGTTLRCRIYSDSAQTNLLTTLTLNLVFSTGNYRYLFACNTYNDGQTGYANDDIDNLDINAPPIAPTGCTSYYQPTNQTRGGWTDRSYDETGFRIERDQDGAGFSFWKNVGVSVVTSGWETRGADHRIRYRIRAYNANGDSTWSTSGYIYTIPDAPTACIGHIDASQSSHSTWTDQSTYESRFKNEYNVDGAGWIHYEYLGAEIEIGSVKAIGQNHYIQWRVRAERTTPTALQSAYSTSNKVFFMEKTDILGLTDTVKKQPSIIRTEILGLIDTYSRVWTVQRVYSELLGLLDTYSDIWSIYRIYTESFGLVDTSQKHSGKMQIESLGLIDSVKKYSSIMKTELLGLTDVYSRTWNAYRIYSELLGLIDSVEKRPSLTRIEYLGLLDTTTKKPDKNLTESLGFLDTTIKELLITRTELLGLVDTTTKDIRRSFIDYFGLIDSYNKVWSISRTYTETFGLDDAVSKGLSKSFTELLGLKDWHSHTLNPLLIYEYIDKLIKLVEIER